MTNFKFFKTIHDANQFIKQMGYGAMYIRHADGTPSRNFQSTLLQIRANGYMIDDSYYAVVLWNGGAPNE